MLAKKQKTFQSILMKIKDKRVNLTNETLTGVKLIKYSAWESDFIERISEIRNAELKQLMKYLVRFTDSLFNCACAVVVS